MAKSTTRSVGSNCRYNPNSETNEILQVAAANWEVLRRVPKFQEVAAKWIQDGTFRFSYGCENIYNDNAQARCALDWMITVGQRTTLAEHQMDCFRFKWNSDANYGPIIVQRILSRQNEGLRECIRQLFDLTPNPDPAGTLKTDQPWPATPEKFRSQFLSIFDEPDLQELKFEDHGLALSRIGNCLLSSKPLPEHLVAAGRYFFQEGEKLRLIASDYKVFAIRRSYYPEKHIDEILRRIKESLHFERRTGHDRTSKRSFLGTSDQWDKFLAWEAQGQNAYKAAAELLPKPGGVAGNMGRLRGQASRSEKQRDAAASVRNAVKAIQAWYPKTYPIRNLLLAHHSNGQTSD
jgi:hypothetical protein